MTLEDFTRGAAAQLGFDPDELDDTDPDEPDGPPDDLAADAAADDEPDPELAERFWNSLSEQELDLAEGDEEERQRLWDAFLEAEGIGDDPEAEDAEADDEPFDQASAPTTGVEVIESVLEAERAGELVDAGGGRITAAEWVSWAIGAPEREWTAAAKAVGFDPKIRVSHGDLRAFGHGAQGAVFAVDWERDLARIRDRGGYL